MTGSDYRVRATHPRRGGPLRLTDKHGAFLAASGDLCTQMPADVLASLIANDYVERVPTPKPAARPAKGED